VRGLATPLDQRLPAHGSAACGALAKSEDRTGKVEPMKAILRIAPAFALLLSANISWAQIPIHCGDTIPGEINPVGNRDSYTFQALAGERVSITVGSSYLEYINNEERWTLFDPTGTLVLTCVSNQCESGPLPLSGTYTIKVFEAGYDETGSYAVSLEGVSEGATCGQGVNCGTTLAARFDEAGDTDSYAFEGTAGYGVTITVAADCGDIYLEESWVLFDPNGSEVLTCLGSCNSGPLPVSGTYTIKVFEGGYDESGAYTLTVVGPSCQPPARCLGGPDADGDGVCDADDNCRDHYNPGQIDTNHDGFGNACDPDYDDNGAVGISDFNTLRGQFGKTRCNDDFDSEVDCDGNGAIGISDFNCLRRLFGGPPGP
jgi:hypothetical protein